MAQFKKTFKNLEIIRQRQYPQRRGTDYQPSIRATAKNAPSVSWAVTLTPAKLGGREFHLLGLPAQWFGLFALYHPASWDIWEERVLHPHPHVHPLHGHESAAGLELMSFKGTLDVADRMGRLHHHPKVADRSNPCEPKWLPWPYLGDLLLFLRDSQGPYCVNWTIKDTAKAFRRPGPKPRAKPRADVDDANASARADLEVQYYLDAGIRTQKLSADDIDKDVRYNLYELFLSHRRELNLPPETIAAAVKHYTDAVDADEPAFKASQWIEAELGLTKEEAITLLKQAVWRRQVRVDLFKPLLMDRPLRAERVDVVIHYADWFAR